MEERNILHAIKEGRLSGFVTPYIATAFQSTLLKERYE
jgi:hypothetical protein